jgi:NADP-dependent 3-hydroxy acid dehydrogenase YdfG
MFHQTIKPILHTPLPTAPPLPRTVRRSERITELNSRSGDTNTDMLDVVDALSRLTNETVSSRLDGLKDLWNSSPILSHDKNALLEVLDSKRLSSADIEDLYTLSHVLLPRMEQRTPNNVPLLISMVYALF